MGKLTEFHQLSVGEKFDKLAMWALGSFVALFAGGVYFVCALGLGVLVAHASPAAGNVVFCALLVWPFVGWGVYRVLLRREYRRERDAARRRQATADLVGKLTTEDRAWLRQHGVTL